MSSPPIDFSAAAAAWRAARVAVRLPSRFGLDCACNHFSLRLCERLLIPRYLMAIPFSHLSKALKSTFELPPGFNFVMRR